MHSVNLDLLRATARHFPDGQPKDPHAHHRAEHLAARRATRQDRWRAALASLTAPFAKVRAKATAAPVARHPACP
jgi:hypothetical protein